MDDLLDWVGADIAELVEGSLQFILSVLLITTGIVMMLASVFVDGLFIWSVLIFVGGIVIGALSAASLMDSLV